MNDVKSRQSTVLLTLSAAFEYYDFVVYALMAGYLGALFFPGNNPLVAQIQVFSVFALGYVIRPLGGMIIGMLGDLTNRKTVFIRSNFILAIATLTISVLPTYNQIGMIATIILILLRMVQSLCFAAELPGAMSLIQAVSDKPAKSFSFIISGTALGTILATATLFWLESNFDNQEILDYAWRLPFIIGSLLCFVSILMRLKLPEFTQVRAKNKAELIKNILPQYRNIITSVLVIALPAYLIIMNLFFPSFLPKLYGYQTIDIYMGISISIFWAMIYAPIFASITSSISKIILLKITVALGIFLGLLVNFLLLRGGIVNLVFALCIYQSLICSLMVTIFPLMAEIFPSKLRFTLMAVCYNVAYSIMAFAPALVISLANSWQTPFSLWLIMILLSIFILANISGLTVEGNKNLNND